RERLANLRRDQVRRDRSPGGTALRRRGWRRGNVALQGRDLGSCALDVGIPFGEARQEVGQLLLEPRQLRQSWVDRHERLTRWARHDGRPRGRSLGLELEQLALLREAHLGQGVPPELVVELTEDGQIRLHLLWQLSQMLPLELAHPLLLHVQALLRV